MADDFASCWRDISIDPTTGFETPITRCRIAGGDIVNYASDDVVPAVLYPDAGVILTGDCWFYTSRVTQWVFIHLFVNGDATLGWDPDPANPGTIAFATDDIPRCTSEPNVLVDPSAEAWAYVMAYIHPPPTPDLNPDIGRGVTGLDTFVSVPIPDDHSTTLGAGGVSLDIEIEVDGVKVAWGDGESDTYPASSQAMAGFPDGIATHVYEIKDPVGYDIAVSYDWTARWRIPGEPWELLAVPDTTTTVVYPISEIVSVITE